MRLFWRKNRDPADKRRRHGRPSSVDANGPSRPSDDDVTACFQDVTGCFQDEDWDQINDLLSCQKPGDRPSYLESSSNAVTSSLAELRASIGQQIMPSGPILDRLLDVWALVHEVDRQAARPVESLLSSLVARDLVSAKEVTGTCDEIEAALEAHRPRVLEVAPGQIARRVPREGTSVSSEEVAR